MERKSSIGISNAKNADSEWQLKTFQNEKKNNKYLFTSLGQRVSKSERKKRLEETKTKRNNKTDTI